MNLKVLGSSSKGNCYILESQTGSLILESGIPFKEIKKGLDFDLSGVVGCLVTHSHKDHCKSVIDVLNAGIDCYMSNGTAFETGVRDDKPTVKYHRAHMVKSLSQFNIGDFTILPFDTEHDTSEPLGFLIHYRPTGEKLLFITDSYYCKYRFNGLNYIMIECNYCKDVLAQNIELGFVDEGMKKRLLESHFSLEHVEDFLKANDLSQCRNIVLLHLSDGNSDESRMKREVNELTGIDTVVADTGLEVELELYPY